MINLECSTNKRCQNKRFYSVTDNLVVIASVKFGESQANASCDNDPYRCCLFWCLFADHTTQYKLCLSMTMLYGATIHFITTTVLIICTHLSLSPPARSLLFSCSFSRCRTSLCSIASSNSRCILRFCEFIRVHSSSASSSCLFNAFTRLLTLSTW